MRSLQPLSWKLRALWHYLIGEYWCRRFHRPLFTSPGGYGGVDVWGRKQQEYHGVRCVKCNRHWEKRGKPREQTGEEQRACKVAFGDMWVGPPGNKDAPPTRKFREYTCLDCTHRYYPTRYDKTGWVRRCPACGGKRASYDRNADPATADN